MKHFALHCIPWLAVCLCASAQAAGPGLGKAYDACMSRANGVTESMMDCVLTEYKRQDARLNAAYKSAMAWLPAPRKTQLQEAQRAWLKFRDSNCAFYNDPEGGSLVRVEANMCMMNTTAHRAQELEGIRQQ